MTVKRKHPLAICEIKLTNSQEVAVISRIDYERVISRRWYLSTNGYAKATDHINPRWLHLFIMEVNSGVDHKNGNRLDNTRTNLRLADQQQNTRNSAKRAGKYTSKHKGVYWNKINEKWIAQICIDGKSKYLGSFALEQDAADKYNEVAKEVFGEFARASTS